MTYIIMKISMAVSLPKHVDVIIDVVTDAGAIPATSTLPPTKLSYAALTRGGSSTKAAFITTGVNRFDVRRDIIIACVG